jgi:putative oxidoreductase
MSDVLIAISRALMAALFIVVGYIEVVDVGTVTNHPGARRFMDLVAAGDATPRWFGYFIAGFELFGGLAILLGFKTRGVAWAFVVFLLLTTGFVHSFWLLEGAARAATQAHFFKNLAIMGGFLLLAMMGGGRYSLDQVMSKAAASPARAA